jgi:O-antigen biosynthesis protein
MRKIRFLGQQIKDQFRRRKMTIIQLRRDIPLIVKTVIREHGWRYLINKVLIKTLPKSYSNLLQIIRENSKSLDRDYNLWLSKNMPNSAGIAEMSEVIQVFNYKPLISIVIPICSFDSNFIKQACESIKNQVYSFLEIIFVGNFSERENLREYIESLFIIEQKVLVVDTNTEYCESELLNIGLFKALGEYIIFFNPHDLLAPNALYEIAKSLNIDPNIDLIYSDEDEVDSIGKFISPHFKPDWCPESFLSRFYIGQLCVYRRSLILDLGGLRRQYNNFHFNDLILRLSEKTKEIYHIPKILYHTRTSKTGKHNNRLEILAYDQLAINSISEVLARRGEPGEIQVTHINNSTQKNFVSSVYKISYKIFKEDLVNIIIPTRDLHEVLNKCLKSIFEKTTYSNFQVLIIDNGSVEEATFSTLNQWRMSYPDKFSSVRLDIPFNFSKINNIAVSHTSGKYLLFLNNDTEVISSDWIEGLVEQAQRPQIGAVGALLLYPDKTIQHAGVIAGLGGMAGESHRYCLYDDPGYFNTLQSVTNYSAVTAACLMCRREVFDEIGGFEEQLSIAFNDVDLCFKMLDKGYRNVYLPHVMLYHYESKSRGYEDTSEKFNRFMDEQNYMRKKWMSIISKDPCYNPNLNKGVSGYKISV